MSTSTAPLGPRAAELAVDPVAYALALREHLADNAADYDRWRGHEPMTVAERNDHHAALLRALHDDGGWTRYGWPEPAGLGGDPRHRAALYDELSSAGLPVPDQCLVLETLGNPVVHFAPSLAAEVMPALFTGAQWWGQGFSEPEAGSDLAALRCRARRDGDHYVVSGQKLWMSFGATAHRFVCLVRTGTPEARHRGLTMLMIDADAPGVSRRPVALASGQEEVSEVFFDDVRVPLSRAIGAQDQGWAVAMYLLQFERSMFAWQSAGIALRRLRDLRGRLASSGTPLPDGTTGRLGSTYADIVTLRSRSAATIRRLAAGDTVGPEASVDKILLATVETGLHDLARDALGADFLLADPQDPHALDSTAWRAEWWYSRSSTILGGSAEVQRTILADHVLGLPQESSR